MRDAVAAGSSLWPVVAGPYLAACILLVGAGLPKLRDPMPLVRALRSAGLSSGAPAGRLSVRVVAAAEVVVGTAAALVPGRGTALLVLLSYLGFTAFVVRVRRTGGVLASCGCFGKADTPATRTHIALTCALAVVAAAVAVRPPRAPVWAPVWPPASPPLALAVTGYAALLAFLAYLVMAVLPSVGPGARVKRSGSSPASRSLARSSPRRG